MDEILEQIEKHWVAILIGVGVVVVLCFVFNVELTAGTPLGYIGNNQMLKLLVYHPGEESDPDKIGELQPSRDGFVNSGGWMIFMNMEPNQPDVEVIQPSVPGNRIFLFVSGKGWYPTESSGVQPTRCPFWQRGFCFWLSGKVTLVNPNQILAIAR